MDSSDVPALDERSADPRPASMRAMRVRFGAATRIPVPAWIALWLLGVVAGLAALAFHANRPGSAGDAPTRWPTWSRLQRTAGRPTVVVGLHPGCPCSRATLEELDRLMARTDGRATVHALVFKPSDFAEDWQKTDIWRRATAIPGVTVMRDDDGLEASRFGAVTSGHVVLYDANDRLRFSGGITAARGHAGDNAGADAVVEVLTRDDGSGMLHHTPVFGCSLGEIASRDGAAR